MIKRGVLCFIDVFHYENQNYHTKGVGKILSQAISKTNQMRTTIYLNLLFCVFVL